MRNIIPTVVVSFVFLTTVRGQQLPLSESYFINRYALSSAYAGNSENGTAFMDYRRDWAGVDQGPRTLRFSYHSAMGNNAGLGGRAIVDSFGIFEGIYATASYSYRLRLGTEAQVYLGLSAGLYRRSINFGNYYNDPDFTVDPSMFAGDVGSRAKFVSDLSAIYAWKGLQIGALLANIAMGDFSYAEIATNDDPLVTYQFHTLYSINYGYDWDFVPMIILRGGKNVKSQFEVAAQVRYDDRLWASIGHRGENIISLGAGMKIGRGILLNYSYNFSSGNNIGTLNNHALALGANLRQIIKGRP